MGAIVAFKSKKELLNSTAETVQSVQELVETHYEIAVKLAQQILRTWGVKLVKEEVESAAGLALCQAAKGYQPKHQAKFTTYLHYFIKGALSESISFNRSCSDLLQKNQAEGSKEMMPSAEIEIAKVLKEVETTARADNPDQMLHLKQVRKECSKAIERLSSLEKVVIFQVDVLGYKVANLAIKLGYSRGYLSEIRSKAERQLRNNLGHLRMVA